METSRQRETDSGMRLTSEARAVDGGGLRLSGVGENLARDPRSVSFLLFIRSFVSSTFLCGHKNEQMKERNNYIQWEQQCPNLCFPLFSSPR
jgi:hypothetical protein